MARTSNDKYLEMGVERLEDRKMMAGDVAVDVSGSGTLKIEGDNLDNEIVVSEVADNTIRVLGINGVRSSPA